MESEALQAEDVWLLPGWQNSDADHWQSRWQALYGYRRLEQHDWLRPLRGDWSIRLQETVLDAPRPVVLAAHSLGCVLVAGVYGGLTATRKVLWIQAAPAALGLALLLASSA